MGRSCRRSEAIEEGDEEDCAEWKDRHNGEISKIKLEVGEKEDEAYRSVSSYLNEVVD